MRVMLGLLLKGAVRLSMVKVFVSLGSNINREHNIRSGIKALQDSFGELVLSSVYESDAEGFKGDPFYNLVVGFAADNHIEVHKILHEIEDHHGRIRGQEKFSSRTLDLDLLFFGSEDLRAQGLDVPRQEVIQYAFILWPLAEIAPDFVHPTENRSIEALWRAYKAQHMGSLGSIKKLSFAWV